MKPTKAQIDKLRAEGRSEAYIESFITGFEEGWELDMAYFRSLIQAGRMDDLKRAAFDDEFFRKEIEAFEANRS